MILEARMAAARRAGRAAALAHAPWDSNPYDGASSVAVDRVLSVMWRRGFSSPPADLSLSDTSLLELEHLFPPPPVQM